MPSSPARTQSFIRSNRLASDVYSGGLRSYSHVKSVRNVAGSLLGSEMLERIIRGNPLGLVNNGDTFDSSEWWTSKRVGLVVGPTRKVVGTPMPGYAA